MRWLVLGCVTLVGCDDTIFPPNARDYTADWAGVEQFMYAECANCHPSIEPSVDLPRDLHSDVCNADGYLVVAGDPDASMLWRIVSGELNETDPPQMPFGQPPIPADDIEFLRQWIATGASIEDCP